MATQLLVLNTWRGTCEVIISFYFTCNMVFVVEHVMTKLKREKYMYQKKKKKRVCAVDTHEPRDLYI